MKGLGLLEALCQSDRPLPIAVLSKELGIARSAVHRLLSTLMRLELVEQDPATRRYLPTMRVWERGSLVAERSPIKSSARSVLRRLSAQCGAFSFLSILSGTDVIYFERIELADEVRGVPDTGSRVPALFPASGRVLLAHHPDREALVRHIMDTEPRAEGLDLPTVMNEFEAIRQAGYAVSVSGWTREAAAIAVAVASPTSAPVAAIGIGLPLERTDPAKLPDFAPLLFRYAAELAALNLQWL